MYNKLSKYSGGFINNVQKSLVAGSLVTALIGETLSSAQIVQYNNNQIITTVNVVSNDAITFAVNNVDKYYPDMKEHLIIMVNSFREQEHQDSTVVLLNNMLKNIHDPAQKTGAVIYAMEMRVFFKSKFSDKYDSKITDETFKYIEIFDTEYKERFKRYYSRLLKKTERLKQEIIRKQGELKDKQGILHSSLQEFKTLTAKFTPQDIQKIPGMKARMHDVQKFYVSNHFPISLHLQSLFDATK